MDARTPTRSAVVGNSIRVGAGASSEKSSPAGATFGSILFVAPSSDNGQQISPPQFFVDLNCDQIVDAIVAGREQYDLKAFFYQSVHLVDAVNYRQEVMRDLENDALHHCVTVFSRSMQEIRDRLARAQKLHYTEQRQAWFVDAVQLYCESVRRFSDELQKQAFASRGFSALRKYMRSYTESDRFGALVSEAEEVKASLATVTYDVQINGSGFTVSDYRGEPDYSAEVEATFEKFKQGAPQDYRVNFRSSEEMNHIEAKILEFVAKLNPAVFTSLADFTQRHAGFLDATIITFDREVQFYVAYLEYIAELRIAGLDFCYPSVSDTSKDVHALDCFDLALAKKIVSQGIPIVCNDFHFRGQERVLVISGPNQGGKTTFARAFGQLHYLASIGCPVPGKEATLFLFDRLLTHFEKEEKVENHRGKLEDDLLRVREILCQATSRSIVVMNEIFTSTTIQDEIFLSERIMEKIIDLGLLCVWVTFADELASFSRATVSMVSTVLPDNPAFRTFKVVRRPADGLAYAMAIATKYGLSYDMIKQRVTT